MSSPRLYPSWSERPSQDPIHARTTFGVDYSLSVPTTTTVATTSTTTAQEHPSSHGDNNTLTTTTTTTASSSSSSSSSSSAATNMRLVLKPNEPIPLSTYISLSQVAVSSALKVAMVSTSLSLGVARTIVSSLDKILSMAVRGVVGQNDPGSRGLNPAFVASLPFRAALLGINFSDILVQTILETVDGSVNLALNTVQDGLDLMDTLFGPDSTSQTGETFREVWAMLSREFIQTDEKENTAGGYPALEGMRLFMAYIAIQFATSEHWETIRVRTQCRLVGECFESKDEENGSSNSWAAVGAWPEEWTKGPLALSSEELLEQQRLVELRDHREGRSSASFYSRSPTFSALPSSSSRTPNPELTNLLAESYRFSRFCSAMYGITFLEIMGAPERYPPGPPGSGPANGPSTEPPTYSTSSNETDNHFHHYTGTPLGSILYSSDTAATIHDGLYSPRYYLLDDIETKQIVLVLRGTKSLHDIMIDLTCDASDLWLDHDSTPTSSFTVSGQNGTGQNGQQRKKKPFKVHSGFLKAARTIASADTIGIQEKIKAALEDRPGYSLLLIGHSLGAGIASVLSMLWADPATGLTPKLPRHTSTRSSSAAPLTDLPSGLGLSGVQWRDWNEEERQKQFLPGYSPDSSAETFLPPGRRVRCYAYGTPKVMCPRMSKRAIKLVTSISYGDDVVGRLSLGSVRNISHAMRAILAMRPPPPASPPATPSPPSSPVLALTTTNNEDVEVLHDSEETLDELLEQEGEGLDRERREASQQQEGKESKESKKPAYKSIGLEIVQKVIRWNLTKEEHLFEEFMDIRRTMHEEMQKHQEVDYDDEDIEMHGSSSDPSSVNYSKVSPMLVPAGKVLWVRPTTLEKELENEETKQHPIDSVLHQFEWDHPIDRDPGSLLIPKPISQQLHQHLEEDISDSASVRSFKSTVRSGLYPSASASTSPLLSSSPAMSSSPPTSSGVAQNLAPPCPMSPSPSSRRSSNQHVLNRPSTLQRQQSFESMHSTTASIATTTSPSSLQPGSQTTDKLLYRMYAAPNPENVFDEMLFSRRMWSDHLPLTYEFILAGKHAIPVTVPHQDEASGKK